jgi:hypothetical protein
VSCTPLHGDLECWLHRLWSKSSPPKPETGVGGTLDTTDSPSAILPPLSFGGFNPVRQNSASALTPKSDRSYS